MRGVLTVPEDVPGIPGGPALTGAALEAGEAVVTVASGFADPCTVLIPTVERFGSHLARVTSTTWQCLRAAHDGHAGACDLPEAERALRIGAVQAADTIVASVDAADGRSWRSVMAGLARPNQQTPAQSPVDLPAGLSGRALRVVESAVRIRAMVAEAGRSAEGWGDPATSAALRSLDTLARQALVAAATPRMDW